MSFVSFSSFEVYIQGLCSQVVAQWEQKRNERNWASKTQTSPSSVMEIGKRHIFPVARQPEPISLYDDGANLIVIAANSELKRTDSVNRSTSESLNNNNNPLSWSYLYHPA